MKLCKTCKQEKPIDSFYEINYIKKDGTKARYHQCKPCAIATSAKQREGDSREAYLAYQRVYHKKNDRLNRLKRLAKMDLLKNKPCEDCGNSYPPECMDFDHMDPTIKDFSISNAVVTGARGWDVIMLEVAKCRLICSNCHRIRTARQQRRGQ